jgi:hypothetical protein
MRVNNVVSLEICQRDVPKVPFFKAVLVSTAGEVQKLQHLDFSLGAVGAQDCSPVNFEERKNHETSP